MNSTRSAAVVLLSLGLVVAGCGRDDPKPLALDSGDTYRVVDALSELPSTALDDDDALILTGDLSAASDLGDLDRPSDPGDEAALQWLSALGGGSAASGEVFVPLPEGLTSAAGQLSDMHDLYGWSLLDVDAFAAVSSPPDNFTVVSGDFDQDTLDADLQRVRDGILTDRDGEDNELDISATTPLSSVGAPTRLSQQDRRIAFSSSTPTLSTWLEGAGSAADDESLGAVASALDQHDVYSAVLGRSGQGMAAEDGGPDASFDVVGLGWGHHDDAAVVFSAYHFASDTSAEGAVDSLRDLYTSGTSIVSGGPFSDSFTVEDVRVEGAVVVVSARPVADAPVDVLYRALMTRDVLFTSR